MNKMFKMKRGMVLLTTLLIIGFLVMIVTGSMMSSMQELFIASNYYQDQAAYQTALAGINYAMFRLGQNPAWQGCEPGTGAGSDFTLVTSDEFEGLEVYERQVAGNRGAVEGKVNLGEVAGENMHGYFDIYFIQPTSAAPHMTFFTGEEGVGEMPEGGLIPAGIPLSYNNNGNPVYNPNANSENTNTLNGSSGSSESKVSRVVPENSILLVCRGKVGKEEKIIETCIRLGPPSSFDSVVVGRSDIEINVNEEGTLELKEGDEKKPPVMRSGGDIKLYKGDPSDTQTDPEDWITVEGDEGGGRCNESVVFNPSPLKDNEKKFMGNQTVDIESVLPELDVDEMLPTVESNNVIHAGIYKLEQLTEADGVTPSSAEFPKVTYYPMEDCDSIDENLTYPSADLNRSLPDDADASLSKLKSLIDTSQTGTDVTKPLLWDNETCTLYLKDDIKIAHRDYELTEVDRNGNTTSTKVPLNGIRFISDGVKRISVKLDSAPKAQQGADVTRTPVYFINDNTNGNIAVDGELSGVGMVYSEADIELEAESQFAADEVHGIGLYAKNNIIIDEIEEIPMDLEVFSQTNPSNLDTSTVTTALSVLNDVIDIESRFDRVQANFAANNSAADIKSDLSVTLNNNGNGLANALADVENRRPGNNGRGRGHGRGGVKASIDLNSLDDARKNAIISLGLAKKKKDGSLKFKVNKHTDRQLEYLVNRNIQIVDPAASEPVNIKDSVFKGLVFSCKDFIVNSTDTGFRLEGGLVAYGGDPTTVDSEGKCSTLYYGENNEKTGKIKIIAHDAQFIYDTKYLSIFQNSSNMAATPLYWAEVPKN